MSHQTDEQLELYALGRLAEPNLAATEEHLLVCPFCQERLDELESFALAMRQALVKNAADGVPEGVGADWFAWFRRLAVAPSFAWAGAVAAAVLVAGLYLSSDRVSMSRNRIAPVASLQLAAMRGEVQSVEPARETDLTLADAPIPVETPFRVEVVDATGALVWSGMSAAKVKITKQLAQGTYFVRLYDGTAKLLHEYGFRVRDARSEGDGG